MTEQFADYNYANLMPEAETNRGFEIHELAPGMRTTKPYDEVMLFGKLPEHREIINRAIDKHYEEGDYEVVADDDPSVGAWISYVSVPAAELSEKVGHEVSPGRITAETEIDEPTRHALMDYFPQEEATKEIKRKMLWSREVGYMGLPEDCFQPGMTVSQIFEVNNGRGGSFNIFNFSDTPVEGVHLQQLMNAVREMDDLTGGASTIDVAAMAILPRSLPRWKQNVTGGDTELQNDEALAATTPQQAILFNEVLFQPDGFQFTEGAENNTVGGTRSPVQTTTFHELAHAVEHVLVASGKTLPSEKYGWEVPRHDDGSVNYKESSTYKGDPEKRSPSPYGDLTHREDVAETATAMFTGEEWAEKVDNARKQAIIDMYAERHTGQGGPTYLRCQELDLHVVSQEGNQIGTALTQPVRFKPQIIYNVR